MLCNVEDSDGDDFIVVCTGMTLYYKLYTIKSFIVVYTGTTCTVTCTLQGRVQVTYAECGLTGGTSLSLSMTCMVLRWQALAKSRFEIARRSGAGDGGMMCAAW